MKEYEKKILMKYLRNFLGNQTETVSNEDYIDFNDDTCFSIDEIDDLYDQYTQIQFEIDTYIDDNELDDLDDNIKIQDHFMELSDYLELNQGCLIDFKDYVMKIIESRGV